MHKTVLIGVLLAAVLAGAGPASAAGDRARPGVSFTTTNGSVVVSGPQEAADAGLPTTVAGRATDDVSGVKSVRVLYCSGGQQEAGWSCGGIFASPIDPIVTRTATVRCSSSTRRSCSWSATVPETPGSYLVFVTATDRYGRTRSAGPIQVLVV